MDTGGLSFVLPVCTFRKGASTLISVTVYQRTQHPLHCPEIIEYGPEWPRRLMLRPGVTLSGYATEAPLTAPQKTSPRGRASVGTADTKGQRHQTHGRRLVRGRGGGALGLHGGRSADHRWGGEIGHPAGGTHVCNGGPLAGRAILLSPFCLGIEGRPSAAGQPQLRSSDSVGAAQCSACQQVVLGRAQYRESVSRGVGKKACPGGGGV